MVLLLGGLMISLTLSRKPQDIRYQASTNNLVDKQCDWCGNACVIKTENQNCIAIAPPEGAICKTEDDGSCTIIYGDTGDSKCDQCSIADFDHDGDVDFDDYNYIVQKLTKSRLGPIEGPIDVDLNHDGKVNLKDYSLFVKEWLVQNSQK